MSDEFRMGRRNIGALNHAEITEDNLTLAQQIMKFNLLVMQTFSGKAQTPEELADRFTEYFEMCIENGRIPTVERTCACFWLRKKKLL